MNPWSFTCVAKQVDFLLLLCVASVFKKMDYGYKGFMKSVVLLI